MGDYFQIIVDADASEEESPALANEILDWLINEGVVEREVRDCVLGSDSGYPPGPNSSRVTEEGREVEQLWSNGLNVIVGRTFFWCGQGGPDLICAECRERFDAPKGWADAIGEWYERKGPGDFACPKCGAVRAVAEWHHEPACGFGHLGFEFWNWPRLKKEFIDAVASRLGHRVIFVAGKL